MDDNNSSTFQGHPFYLALTIFKAAARIPFAIAAAWRPWFTEPGKRKVPTRSNQKYRPRMSSSRSQKKRARQLRQNQSLKSLTTQSGRHQRLCRKKWR